MVMLKALDLRALTPEMLGFFAEDQVLTVEDFLCHDLHSLAIKAERSLVTPAFNQAVRAVLSHLEKFQGGWSQGSEFLEDGTQFLPISCESVDSLLNGGLQEGTITELVGASSTGKSQMCMQAAASVAYWLHSTVIYVDTCRTFSGNRIAEIVDSFLARNQTRRKEQKDSVSLVMKCIQRIGVFDVFSMLSFLRSLHGSLLSKPKIEGDGTHVRLLIIDSASSVVSPVLGATNSRDIASLIILCLSYNLESHPPLLPMGLNEWISGFRRQASDGSTLSGCSWDPPSAKLDPKETLDPVVHNGGSAPMICCQITNHTVTGDEGQIKAALGESWVSVPHVRLWLSRDSNNDICEASLSKHTSLACHKQAAFSIGKGGLQSIDDIRNSMTPSSSH